MDRQRIERSIKGLSEWQMYVQAESDIDTNISTAIEALKAQLSKEGTTKDTTSDLISRQQALDIFDDYNISVENGELEAYSRDRKRLCELQSVQPVATDIIKALPTAQPEPHEGHWIRRDCGLDVECKCSKCGYRDFVEPRDEYWFKRNYCPNCGAKMKGERQK